jgi:hypothetical protein
MDTFFYYLFPFIILMYLVDCIALVKKHQMIFFTILGNHFWLKKSGILLLGLFPISEVIHAVKEPICFTKLGLFFLCKNVSEYKNPSNITFISYKNINLVETQSNAITINRAIKVIYPNNNSANRISVLIRKLILVENNLLQKEIQKINSQSTDIKEIIRIRHHNKRQLYFLYVCETIFFILLFIIIPIYIYTELRFYLNPLGLLIPLIISYLATVTLAIIKRKDIIGLDKNKARLSTILTILSPITSLHIATELTKNTLSEFEYLALAAVLLPADEFYFLIRREILLTATAKLEHDKLEWQEYWEQREQKSRTILAQKGMNVQELFSTPVKKDCNADKYCPLCLSEYKIVAKQCSTCGIPLKNY